MPSYQTNIVLVQAVHVLREARRIVVTTHAKPDGDAYGAVTALVAALRALGKDASGRLMPPMHPSIDALHGRELSALFHEGDSLGEPDLLVIVDTGAWAQLAPMRGEVERLLDGTLIIDHRLSGDVPAKQRYIDGKAAASCEIMTLVIEALGVADDPLVSESLFVGIASDTGWFRFSNVRPLTHEIAGRLIGRGVDHASLFGRLEQAERAEKLQLLIRALDSLQLIADDQAAVMTLRAADFAQTHTSIEETERFVDVPQMVQSVQVVVLITEPPADGGSKPQPVRLSFRSKPGAQAVNVAELAQRFGGGGHSRAAGAKVDAPVDDVVTRVITAIGEALTAAKK